MRQTWISSLTQEGDSLTFVPSCHLIAVCCSPLSRTPTHPLTHTPSSHPPHIRPLRYRTHGHNVNQIVHMLCGNSIDSPSPTQISDFLVSTTWTPPAGKSRSKSKSKSRSRSRSRSKIDEGGDMGLRVYFSILVQCLVSCGVVY